MTALSVRGATVRFDDVTVLDGVDLDVGSGEIVALLGPSGSGKSTLLRVVTGLLTPDAGQVLLDGVDVTRTPTHRRGIGLVFQDEQLFPHLDVAGNVGSASAGLVTRPMPGSLGWPRCSTWSVWPICDAGG